MQKKKKNEFHFTIGTINHKMKDFKLLFFKFFIIYYISLSAPRNKKTPNQ